MTFWSVEQESLPSSARTFVERNVLPHLHRWEDERRDLAARLLGFSS